MCSPAIQKIHSQGGLQSVPMMNGCSEFPPPLNKIQGPLNAVKPFEGLYVFEQGSARPCSNSTYLDHGQNVGSILAPGSWAPFQGCWGYSLLPQVGTRLAVRQVAGRPADVRFQEGNHTSTLFHGTEGWLTNGIRNLSTAKGRP